MSIAEEQQLRKNEEVYESAINITPQAAKADKRKFPSLPDKYEKLQWLLLHYIRAGRRLFMHKKGHIQEVHNIKTALIYVYLRNGGSISRNYICGLLWDIIIDIAQYFYSFPTADYFATNDNIKYLKQPQGKTRTVRNEHIYHSYVECSKSHGPGIAWSHK